MTKLADKFVRKTWPKLTYESDFSFLERGQKVIWTELMYLKTRMDSKSILYQYLMECAPADVIEVEKNTVAMYNNTMSKLGVKILLCNNFEIVFEIGALAPVDYARRKEYKHESSAVIDRATGKFVSVLDDGRVFLVDIDKNGIAKATAGFKYSY